MADHRRFARSVMQIPPGRIPYIFFARLFMKLPLIIAVIWIGNGIIICVKDLRFTVFG